MSSFFERPKIGKPIGIVLAAVLVLVAITVAIVLAYRAGRDADSPGENSESQSETSDEQAAGLEGADEVYDPLTTVSGDEYDSDLYIFRGYEQNYIGAVSAAADWLGAIGGSLDPEYSEQLGEELLVENDNQSPQDWRSWPQDRRADLGLSATGEVRDGYGLTASPMAYQTRNASADRIEVILLIRLTGTSPYGSTEANTILTMDLVWTGDDWADSGNDMGADYTTLKVDVGDENSDAASSLGWRQLVR